MAEEFRVSLGVELKANALDNVRNQINGLQVNPINLQINTRNVQNQINSIRRQIQSLGNIRINLGGNNIGNSGNSGGSRNINNQVNSMNTAYKKLLNISKQIGSIKIKLTGVDTSKDVQQIEVLEKQLRTLTTEYHKCVTKIKNSGQGNLTSNQWQNIQQTIDNTKLKLEQLSAQVRDSRSNLAQSIRVNIDNGSLNNDLSKLQESLFKIKNQSSEVTSGMRQLNAAMSELQASRQSNDVNRIISSYKKYEAALKNVKNQIEINARVEKQAAEASKLDNAKKVFASKMDIWLSKNSAAAKQFGGEINALKAKLEGCDKVQLDQLKAEFADVQRRAEMAGKATMTFGDRFSKQMSRLSTYFSAATLITYSVRAMTQMYNNVVEVDTAMTELYRVTDLSTHQYDVLYDNMISSAKEYGSTLTDIITSTADWVRLGFDANTANRLSEITAMYQHISDLDNDTAVENLVTAYKGFQDQLLNLYNGDEAAAIEYIADIFNELGNKYAVSAEDIGAALTKSASALELAGNTIQESAAMVTGITEVTQDPEKAGSSLKILSLRLRGMKGELEELGEEVDENVDSISKMQTQILNFTGGKVNIFNDDGSFKSTYEIMRGIAEIYDELSSTNQADLLETIAGKNRANDVAALIANWNQVEAAMKSAMEAEGSASAENEKYMQSIQGRLDALKASWQAFSNTVINSDFVKVLITGLTKILELLDSVIKTFGSLGTISSGIAIFNIFKLFKNSNFSLVTLISQLNTFGLSLNNISDIAKSATTSLKAFATTPAGIATSIGLVTAAISLAVRAYKNWETEQARLRQETLDTNNTILSSIDTFEQIYVKYADKTNLTSDEESELRSAIDGTITALGRKSTAIQGVIDKNNDYIKSLENVAKEEIAAAQITAKESLKAASESLQSDAWDLFSGSEITIDLSGRTGVEEFVKAKEVLEGLMGDYIDDGTYGKELEPIGWDSDHTNMDAVVDYYYKLIELKDTLLQKSIDEDDDSWINNDIYESAKSKIDALSNSVEEYLTQQYNLAKYNYELQNGIPKTAEEYYAMRDAILSNINASQGYKDAIGAIADAEWGDILDLDSYNNTLNKINQITKKFTESKPFKDSPWSTAQTQLQEFNEWVNSLSPEDLSIVYDIALNTDTANFTLDEWKNALENYEFPESAKISFSDLIADEDFTGKIDKHIESVNKLQEALKALKKGDFSSSDFVELIKEFPELADNADDLDSAISDLLSTMNTDITSDFANQFGKLETEEDVVALKNFQDAVLELGQVVGDTAISIDIEAEAEGMDNLFKAMKESVSSTGLTAESIKNLKSRYQDLENYDAARLFERTSNGIHLNTKALRELESAYEKQKKTQTNSKLQELVDQYNSLTREINNTSDAAKRAELYAQRADIQDQINDTADLAAMYEGLTSAFYKWEQAQSIGEEGDMYDSLAGSLENIKKLYDEGLIGTNKFRTAVQLMSNEDLSTASIDELLAAYDTGYSKMTRYFTDSSDGCLNFLNDVQKLNSEWVKMNSDGSWDINFGVGDDQNVADALGINVESVQAVLRKLSDYGFDINLDSIYTSLDFLQSEAEKAVEAVNKALKDMGKDPVTFNFDTTNISEIESQITQAKSVLDLFKNSDGTVNLQMEGAEEAQEILIALISQKQLLNAPSVMSIDTSQAEADIGNVIALLQDYQKNYNDIEINTAVGADTSTAQTNIQNILTKLQDIPDEKKTALGLDTTEFNEAIATLTETPVDVNAGVTLNEEALSLVTSTIEAITPTMIVKAGVDPTLVEEYEASEHTTDGTVIYNVNSRDVDRYKAPTKYGTVRYTATINSWTVPTRYGTVIYTAQVSGSTTTTTTKSYSSSSSTTTSSSSSTAKTSSSSSNNTLKTRLNGVANVNGTFGRAYKNGDIGLKSYGIALGGELGQELIVRDGHFFTIGDDSAEFFKYKKGDIIFNAEQTKQIFEKGKISYGSKRGNALVSGTAYAEGNAFSGGSGSIIVSGNVVTKPSSSSEKTQASNTSSNKTEDFLETFDWIEIAIDRVERAIKRLDLKANSIYKSWSNRNSYLKNEIQEIENEIGLQHEAYARYMAQADAVNLSSSWKERVRNGSIDMDYIQNEELAENIKEYQEWYEKALDCKDAIDELNESLSECYKIAFDNVVTQYDGILAVIGHERSMLEEYIAQSEAKGYVTSTKYYDALISNEQATISKLQSEKQELLDSLETAMLSGTIEKGSEAWYEMVTQIDEVTLAIEESNTAVLEYAQSIREIEWQVFDLMQQQISNLTNEANFLIELISNDKLYDNRGKFTNEGIATMGLHGQNYNVYMAQADKYAQEILNIDKELANDPYNQELLERRQELLELQQESILAAEAEKQAIVDMVREGIELELSALQDLIDSYIEALDAQKDLYDYQKKIAKQTKEIVELEKQLSAYAGDTSEEAKAKIQEIKVSLEDAKENLYDTQYDRYISDTKKLLDELYLEYETILNQRLDNIDVLIEDMIASVNSNSNTINTTITDAATSVGYTLSESMQSIWNTSVTGITNVLITYGNVIQNEISDVTSTINSTLNTMNSNLKKMVTQLNEIADMSVQSASTSSSSNSSQANNVGSGNYYNPDSYTGTTKPSTGSSSNSGSSGSSGNSGYSDYSDYIQVGGRINASGAYIYDYAGDTSGERQYYASDPIYTVLKEQNGYLQVRWYKLSSGITGWFKKSDVRAYATGKRNFLSDEIAWTQDGGAEMIVRPSDGAILTPLAKGDSVLNSAASGNIWNMANNPSEFIRDNLRPNMTAPVGSRGNSNYTQNLDKVIFNMPNVKNYDEFIKTMQHDKNFERLVMAMTIDRLAGKTALSKGKSIR
ncbi:MAG: phage tail tape measure protein [Bacteroidales bacterium]|nr:phage tail tape measure protein [Bacteroidales bacterium]